MLESRRKCIREAIPEIAVAAQILSDAADAHKRGDFARAESLIRTADDPAIRDWTESIWGSSSPWLHRRVVESAPPVLSRVDRAPGRMPSSAIKRSLHLRDGFHCRFCEIPLVRKDVRVFLHNIYPAAARWGSVNSSQHAALQAMNAQYDHVLPHARGGTNDISNLVLTCAPCNYGRMNYTVEELGLIDPRLRTPLVTDWDGLERLLVA